MQDTKEVPLVEINKAEESMTPIQAAMTRARSDVMSHEQDLLKVGVTREQIEKATYLAGDRAIKEYEQKKGSDPLRRIIQIVHDAAETPEEKLAAIDAAKNIEKFRSEWQAIVDNARFVAKHAGNPNINIIEIVRQRFERGNHSTITSRKLESGDRAYFLSVAFMGSNLVTDPETGNLINPSEEFKSRILVGLGSLEPGQKIEVLRLLPREDYSLPFTKPVFVEGQGTAVSQAKRVPTSIEGVDVRVAFGHPFLEASLNMTAFSKALELPKT